MGAANVTITKGRGAPISRARCISRGAVRGSCANLEGAVRGSYLEAGGKSSSSEIATCPGLVGVELGGALTSQSRTKR
jgi:hypothetical protein